jgi:hypothetical protein
MLTHHDGVVDLDIPVNDDTAERKTSRRRSLDASKHTPLPNMTNAATVGRTKVLAARRLSISNSPPK